MAFCGQESGQSLELGIWGGTVGDFLDFNAEEDAQALKTAMKGRGADEDEIIKIVGTDKRSFIMVFWCFRV